jgi:hypothetical protein
MPPSMMREAGAPNGPSPHAAIGNGLERLGLYQQQVVAYQSALSTPAAFGLPVVALAVLSCGRIGYRGPIRAEAG